MSPAAAGDAVLSGEGRARPPPARAAYPRGAPGQGGVAFQGAAAAIGRASLYEPTRGGVSSAAKQ